MDQQEIKTRGKYGDEDFGRCVRGEAVFESMEGEPEFQEQATQQRLCGVAQPGPTTVDGCVEKRLARKDGTPGWIQRMRSDDAHGSAALQESLDQQGVVFSGGNFFRMEVRGIESDGEPVHAGEATDCGMFSRKDKYS